MRYFELYVLFVTVRRCSVPTARPAATAAGDRSSTAGLLLEVGDSGQRDGGSYEHMDQVENERFIILALIMYGQ